MGQEVADFIASLDDGVPYWPTISALAESPRVRGVLYAGTDDGQVRVSRDEGRTWTDVASGVPGLPERAWIAGLEASRHADGTVYMTVDQHRSDDNRNYVYASSDFGRTWTSIAGDLPADRVARTIREDPRNPSVLYLGTEFGLFASIDRGAHWIDFRSNMPTLAINDLVVHPRDNDLVLGTHGRGVWILDNLAAVQELAAAASGGAYLFTPEPASQIRFTNLKAHMGDMVFRGTNPPAGAVIDYWLDGPYADVSLTIVDAAGSPVRLVPPGAPRRGVHRVVWNLRHGDVTVPGAAAPAGAGRGGRGGGAARLPGRLVEPGTYTVRLRAGGRTYEQPIEVREDPRIDVSPADRRAWVETLDAIAGAWRRAVAVNASLQASGGAEDRRLASSAQQFLSALYGAVGDYTGRPTADQLAELAYLSEVVARLERAR
jgi:hypothetical protein